MAEIWRKPKRRKELNPKRYSDSACPEQWVLLVRLARNCWSVSSSPPLRRMEKRPSGLVIHTKSITGRHMWTSTALSPAQDGLEIWPAKAARRLQLSHVRAGGSLGSVCTNEARIKDHHLNSAVACTCYCCCRLNLNHLLKSFRNLHINWS